MTSHPKGPSIRGHDAAQVMRSGALLVDADEVTADLRRVAWTHAVATFVRADGRSFAIWKHSIPGWWESVVTSK